MKQSLSAHRWRLFTAWLFGSGPVFNPEPHVVTAGQSIPYLMGTALGIMKRECRRMNRVLTPEEKEQIWSALGMGEDCSEEMNQRLRDWSEGIE